MTPKASPSSASRADAVKKPVPHDAELDGEMQQPEVDPLEAADPWKTPSPMGKKPGGKRTGKQGPRSPAKEAGAADEWEEWNLGTVSSSEKVTEADPDMQKLLQSMAETQNLMAKVLVTKSESYTGPDRKKFLTSVKLEEFSGGRAVTAKAYRTWKRSVEAVRVLHGLTEPELALLIYLSVKGDAKMCLDVLEIEDLQAPDGLQLVWELLDGHHEQLSHDRLDDSYRAWETAHRAHGEPMDMWLSRLLRVKTELETQDTQLTISDRQWASKMLRGTGLPRKDKAQVLFNAGGKLDPKRIEGVLRITYHGIAGQERTEGKVMPRRESRPSGHGHRGRSSFKGSHKHRGTYQADQCPDEVEEDQSEDDDEDSQEEVFEAEQEGAEDDAENEPNDGSDDLETVQESEIQEAFLAGWKAKKRMNSVKKERGFRGKGGSSSGNPPCQHKDPRHDGNAKGAGKVPVDERKKNSHCSDCGKKGHWSGDAICEKVKSGAVPPMFLRKP